MTGTATNLDGLRVIIVEDEAAISLILEEMLTDFGCIVVGSAGKLGEAERLAAIDGIDVAILDVNIAGQEVYPVASMLKSRNIPIIFTTGYGDSGVRSEYHYCSIIQKPFRLSELRQALEQAHPGT